jgi:NADPH:quinone reductase-like Zn-dependent oxidoreductase
MRAISLDHCGGPEVLVVSDVPAPSRKEGEVLIKVVSAGVNPVDLLVASGAYKPAAFPKASSSC